MTEGLLIGRAAGTRWHRPRSVLLCLACVAAGCGESHVRRGDAGPRVDAAADDAAVVGIDAGQDAADAGDSGVPDAAVAPPGLLLADCPAGGGGTVHWPWARWPVPELFEVPPADVAQTDCRILRDVDDDGSIDGQWGYVYRNGLLREIRTTSSRLLFDEQERPWAGCDGETCQLYLYDAGDRVARVVLYDNPPQQPKGLVRSEEDSEGRRVSWRQCPYRPPCPVEAWGRACADGNATYVAGVLQTSEWYDGDGRPRTTYYPDGTVRECSVTWDPESLSASCNAAGWEVALKFCEWTCSYPPNDSKWETSYTLGADGLVVSSVTTTTWPIAGSFTTIWSWAANGQSVQLDSMDDGGLWQESHVTWFDSNDTSERDALGNLTAIHYDDDHDGVPDRRDTYRYEGEGACRQGQAVHLLPTAATPPDVPYGCPFSPVSRAIESMLRSLADAQ